MVLGDHMEVLRTWKFSARELSETKPDPFLYANHVTTGHSGAKPMNTDQYLVQVQDCREGSGACRSVVGCADLNEEKGQETDGATDPGTREPVHVSSFAIINLNQRKENLSWILGPNTCCAGRI